MIWSVAMYVFKKRIFIFYLAIFLGVLSILIRLSYVQIFLGATYYDRALDLWSRSVPVEGRRGNIYDRNGNLIVGNSLAPTVVVIPRQVKNKDQTAHTLAKILKTDYQTMRKHLDKNVSVEILKPDGKKISLNEAKEIAYAKLDGVYLAGDTIRYYPYEHYAAQVIGITGIDNQGITGIEYIYDEYLRGLGGSLNIYTDAHGNKFEDLSGFYKTPTTGFDIYLTLDLGIQVAVERILDYAVARYSPEEAMALVMNPKTSEIYAMASRPTFNPGHYQDYPQEIYNRNLPIWKSFEPGSTFKIVTFAAGLEEKVFKLTDTFHDPGFALVDGARLRDWKAGGHGTETYLEVLQNSCNPGFVSIGLKLGKERFFDYVDRFGFGEKTGVDLLGESKGIIFNPDKIGQVELATSAFGQGISVTPIQLMNAAAAAVNGGILHEPYILKGFGVQGEILYERGPKEIRRIISEETSALVASSLEHVVSLGTGRSGYIDGYRIGGKTGTAQIAHQGVYLDGQYILSFLGIAPMNDPQVMVYVALTKPKNCIQYGGVVTAPLVKEIMMESFTSLGIEKQDGGIPLNARWYIDTVLHPVENYVGMKVKGLRRNPYYHFIIEGNGDYVIAQLPDAGEKIAQDGFVILYT